MREFLRKLFSEGGDVSMMRVMSILSLLAGIGIAFYGMSKLPVDYSGISLLTSVFLSAAFGGKVLQKSQEVKNAKGEITHSTEAELTTKNQKVDNPD